MRRDSSMAVNQGSSNVLGKLGHDEHRIAFFVKDGPIGPVCRKMDGYAAIVNSLEHVWVAHGPGQSSRPLNRADLLLAPV